jgi:hypothetical protein
MLPTPLRLGTLYDKVHLRHERAFRSSSLRLLTGTSVPTQHRA